MRPEVISVAREGRRERMREMKFPLSLAQARAVETWLREWVRRANPEPLRVEESRIITLWLDTPELDTYHDRNAYRRAKLRIRAVEHSDMVALEIRRKRGGRVRTTETPIARDALAEITHAQSLDGPAGQFVKRMQEKRLQPTCLTAYDRLKIQVDDGIQPAEVALDRIMQCAEAQTMTLEPAGSWHPLAGPDAVLEIKFPEALPAELRRMIGEFKLCPRAVSRYRMAVETLGLAGGNESEQK